MRTRIRRKCKCGCGKITKPGDKYINGHNRRDKKHSKKSIKKMSISKMGNVYSKGAERSEEHKRKISLAHKNKIVSEETKNKLSKSLMGNTNAKGNKGKITPKETRIKQSISNIKYNPNYGYCDIWKDKEYKSDLRKNYCENKNCKRSSNQLHNHHIDLDRKNCHPSNIMTLCNSCHIILHRKLESGRKIAVNSKDFLIINRSDHVSYINKKAKKKVVIKRRKKQ